MGVNWDTQRDMDRDVRENKELYEALADTPDDDEEDEEEDNAE